MYVKRKSLIVAIISLFIGIVYYFIFDNVRVQSLGYQELLSFFSLIVKINLIFHIFLIKYLGISFLSPIFLFLMFAYVFHFGQLLMENIYEYEYLNYISVYMKRDLPALIKTLQISFNSINAIFIGVLLFMIFSEKNSNKKLLRPISDINNEKKICQIVGKGLFIISTPFRFLIDISQLIAAIHFGYSGAIGAITMPGIFSAMAGFWYSSILLLYVGKKSKRIFWLGIFYTIFTMLTGNRGHQITNILVMLMVYIHVEKIKVRIKNLIKYSILGYFLLIFIDVIMSFRSVGIQAFFSNFNFYFSKSLKSNIIFETIGSFGETLFTPYLVIKQMGKEINPFFCEAFLYSFGTLIPDINGLTSYTNIASNFAKMLDTRNAIGGSFIGDLYYNLRDLYWLGALLIGWLLCKYSVQYEKCIKSFKYSKLIYLIPIFTNTFWWVRDSIGNEMRPLVWQIVFSLIVVFIYKKRKIKKK